MSLVPSDSKRMHVPRATQPQPHSLETSPELLIEPAVTTHNHTHRPKPVATMHPRSRQKSVVIIEQSQPHSARTRSRLIGRHYLAQAGRECYLAAGVQWVDYRCVLILLTTRTRQQSTTNSPQLTAIPRISYHADT
jgi:hypothetical protein